MLKSAKTTAIEPQPAGRAALSDDSLFRAHFDNLPGPAYIWKRSGDDFALLAYNRAAASLSFSKVAALVGTTVRALQPNVKFDFLTDLEICASRGTVVKREVDYCYIATDTVRRLALSLVPLSTDVVVVHTDDVTERRQTELALRDSESQRQTIADITGRKRAEQALRESEVRSRALLDAHPDLIVRLTGDGRYLDVHCTDKRVERHLPCPPQEFIGKTVGELFDPAFARQHERLRRRALATGEIQRWEYVQRAQGLDLYLEARFVRSGDDEQRA
jgi:PAS domain-containing protein